MNCLRGWRKFGLTLETNKINLVEFGRFAQKWTSKRGRKRPKTIYFLGLRCTAAIGKAIFGLGCVQKRHEARHAILRFQGQIQRLRHSPLQEQEDHLNQMLRVIMRTTAWLTTPEPSSRSIMLLSITGARCRAAKAGKGTVY